MWVLIIILTNVEEFATRQCNQLLMVDSTELSWNNQRECMKSFFFVIPTYYKIHF